MYYPSPHWNLEMSRPPKSFFKNLLELFRKPIGCVPSMAFRIFWTGSYIRNVDFGSVLTTTRVQYLEWVFVERDLLHCVIRPANNLLTSSAYRTSKSKNRCKVLVYRLIDSFGFW